MDSWTPSHTATGPWPPPTPYYPPEWRSQLEEGARREQEKVEIDEVEATNMNGQLKTSKAPITLFFLANLKHVHKDKVLVIK